MRQGEEAAQQYANIYTGSIVWAEEKNLGSIPGYAVTYVKGAAETMWYEKGLFEQWYMKK